MQVECKIHIDQTLKYMNSNKNMNSNWSSILQKHDSKELT